MHLDFAMHAGLLFCVPRETHSNTRTFNVELGLTNPYFSAIDKSGTVS